MGNKLGSAKLISTNKSSAANVVKPSSLEDEINQALNNSITIYNMTESVLYRLRNQGGIASDEKDFEPISLIDKVHKTREIQVKTELLLQQIKSELFTD